MMPMNIEDLDAVKNLTEPIASEIVKLSNRIEQSRDAVSATETATRNYLIEPLLHSLGWDITDPDLVRPEYSAGQGRVDYALMREGTSILLIEAKKLGTKLTAETLLQAFSYVDDESVEFVAISNGDDWKVYRTPLSNLETIATFAVTDDSAHATALEAAKLSRQVLTETGTRISDPTAGTGLTTTTDFQNKGVDHVQPGPTKPTIPSGEGWHDLVDRAFVPARKRAIAVRLRGEVVKTRNFTEAAVEIASWLETEGFPIRDHCPMKFHPNGARYFIALKPTHENGKEFQSRKELPNGMVMEAKASSRSLLMSVRELVELCGVSSEEISIQWVARAKKQ